MSGEAVGLAARARAALDVSDPHWLRFGRAGTALLLVLGSLVIVGWQQLAAVRAAELDSTYRRTSVSGYLRKEYPRFFYFYYYTGLFPVSMLGPEALFVDDPATAHRYLEAPNPNLINEQRVAIRAGDLGKLFLLYPDVWVHGSPLQATLRTFNRLLASASLVALFVALSLRRRCLLAVLLVVFLGSHPFQLFNLYPRNNVFAYPICVASLLLALNAPFVFGRARPRRAWRVVLPLLTGVFLACVREVRTEPALLGASVVLAYLVAPIGWRWRGAAVGLLVAGLLATGAVWSAHWDRSLAEATRVVRDAGGKPFPSLRNTHHALWHPLWCGLGDFGGDRGYVWDDMVAHRYAIPRVNARFGTRYRLVPGTYRLDNRDPTAPDYYLRPETLPEYTEVLRDKVVSDVSDDPLWYASILGRRVLRIFNEPAPIRLQAGTAYVDVPLSAWLAVPVLLGALLARSREQLVLLAFYVPTSATALLIYSGSGNTHGSAFHLMAFAVMGAWYVAAVDRRLRRRAAT